LKIAAVQMTAKTGDVDYNIQQAENLVTQAFQAGAEWVVLPEFFTSGMAFHPDMRHVARPVDGLPFQFLKQLSEKHNGIVGGSFISQKDGDCYNTFVLAFPDGRCFFHDKDQPTMWENCYYIGGTDDGILDTGDLRVGVALCWEFIRTRTARRLLDRVDMVIGGSCWWTFPDVWVPGFTKALRERNLNIMKSTPSRMAKILGRYVIHAAHAGDFEGRLPLVPGFPYRTHLLGETQIVDGSGAILERMPHEAGEGFIIADIDPLTKWTPSEEIPAGFWIPELPLRIQMIWWYQNLHGQNYYQRYRNLKMES
jgi:N-carbamoylputrescine amidase